LGERRAAVLIQRDQRAAVRSVSKAAIAPRALGPLTAHAGERNAGPGPRCGLGAGRGHRANWAFAAGPPLCAGPKQGARCCCWATARARFRPWSRCWAAEPRNRARAPLGRARKRAFGPRTGKKSAAVKQAFGLKYTVTSLKSVLLFQKHI
jgi:hypothetical protein